MPIRSRSDFRASRRSLAPAALAALAILSATACKQTGDAPAEPEPRTGDAEVTEEAVAQAKVLAVDRASRAVTFEREDGTSFVVVAGPEVVNFDRIAIGDVLRVRYVESLAVHLMPPGSEPEAESASMTAAAAQPGQKPSAGLGRQVSVTVRIDSLDVAKDLVAFTAPDGWTRVVRVVRPEGREFLRKLKVGDQVQITYTEAVALAIEEQ